MADFRLTKTHYLSGLQCTKKLWRDKHSPYRSRIFTLTEEHRLQTGRLVGSYAREYFPNGVLVIGSNPEDALKQTKDSLESKQPVIFEAAFLFDDLFVRTDILVQNPDNTWTLLEVKSGTRVKDEYLADVAIQFYCASGAGLNISKVVIQHINNQCIYPNLEELFNEVDVTAKVKAQQQIIAKQVGEQKQILEGAEPLVKIGEHCVEPRACPYKDDICWKDVPEPSIINIPRLSWTKKEDLINNGILAISDIPIDFKLSEAQETFVEGFKRVSPVINLPAIKEQLAELSYPLYFLDFETDSPAIPRYDGCKPYQQIPFQFSCHILDSENSDLRHKEFLHEAYSDPRRPFVETLIDVLGEDGTIVSYNASFEESIIKGLVVAFPDLSDRLNSLLVRVWDQLDLIRQHYFHPAFNGSNSIKAVLPVIIPSLSYETLEQVHDGLEAGAVWNKCFSEFNNEEKERAFQNLRKYCGMDTIAMVEIHKHLKGLIIH